MQKGICPTNGSEVEEVSTGVGESIYWRTTLSRNRYGKHDESLDQAFNNLIQDMDEFMTDAGTFGQYIRTSFVHPCISETDHECISITLILGAKDGLSDEAWIRRKTFFDRKYKMNK